MITYFKEKNCKAKKKQKKLKTLTTKVESFDTIVIIGTTSSSITWTITGNGLITIPISAATAYGLSIGNKVLFEILMQKYIEYKKQYQKINEQLNLFMK